MYVNIIYKSHFTTELVALKNTCYKKNEGSGPGSKMGGDHCSGLRGHTGVGVEELLKTLQKGPDSVSLRGFNTKTPFCKN